MAMRHFAKLLWHLFNQSGIFYVELSQKKFIRKAFARGCTDHSVADVTCLLFSFQACFSATLPDFVFPAVLLFAEKEHFSSCDLELWSMTLTYETELDMVKQRWTTVLSIEVNGHFIRQLLYEHTHSRPTAATGPHKTVDKSGRYMKPVTTYMYLSDCRLLAVLMTHGFVAVAESDAASAPVATVNW